MRGGQCRFVAAARHGGGQQVPELVDRQPPRRAGGGRLIMGKALDLTIVPIHTRLEGAQAALQEAWLSVTANAKSDPIRWLPIQQEIAAVMTRLAAAYAAVLL